MPKLNPLKVACQVLKDMTGVLVAIDFLLSCILVGALYNSYMHVLESFSVQIYDGKVWNEKFVDIQLLMDDQASHTIRPQG